MQSASPLTLSNAIFHRNLSHRVLDLCVEPGLEPGEVVSTLWLDHANLFSTVDPLQWENVTLCVKCRMSQDHQIHLFLGEDL